MRLLVSIFGTKDCIKIITGLDFSYNKKRLVDKNCNFLCVRVCKNIEETNFLGQIETMFFISYKSDDF